MHLPPAARRAAAALALCLVAGRAVAEPPPAARCSIPDAEDWREYRSAHFVLATDASPGDAAKLVAELERLHALVVAALFGEPVEIPGRVRAVAFRNAQRFREVAPEHAAGYVTSTAGPQTIVFPFVGSEPVPEVVAHELAHIVSWHHYARRPRWFSEGLAMFVQSVAEERSRGERWAGAVSPWISWVLRSRRASAKDLLHGRHRPNDLDPGRFHAGSWLLYHYLWNERSRAFSDYQARLAGGDAPAAAWLAAFPQYDPADDKAMGRLDGELDRYARIGSFLPYPVVAGPVDATFRESPLASADLHMLRLGIRAPARWPKASAARDALVRAEVEEALREDPLHPDALWWRAWESVASRAAALRKATAARPGDPRAWYRLAAMLEEPADAGEKELALRKAVSLAPDDARAHNGLAWLLVTSGRGREARPFAERALDLEPWNRAIIDTLAAVAFAIGQCKPALILQRRAADLFPEGDGGTDGVRQRLAEYEAKCGSAADGASAGAAK